MSLATSHAGIATAPDLTTVLLVTLTLLFMLWRTVVLHAVRLEAITPIAVFVTAAQHCVWRPPSLNQETSRKPI